ncbi:MAG: protein-methionine-sulfoxide reductase catalytic subunit MsrP [Chromatiales bacterium]|nr:protein-methionine-sulfoxide reductase catalytic subunit MsrP [Chromatiales bacterium]
MPVNTKNRILPSEITPPEVYFNRRLFMQAGLVAGAGLALPAAADAIPAAHRRLGELRPSPFSTDEAPNTFEEISTYNNFYEFGTGKSDPVRLSHRFNPRPWSVRVDGECDKGGDITLEDLLAPHPLEERIYRLRCVEAWSMVVPWVGFPLGDLLKRFEPNSRAKYVAFETVYRPEEMPGQRARIIDWPYVEGLRMDEAMHPLTILAVGIYGVELPNQNGAPLRLVVPWKYGFKSIKSIVRISFVEEEPPTSWSLSAPREYGFYANVNPEVDHPRWSQARERRIGAGFFAGRQPTLMFNGYAEDVASLYAGMDLQRQF